MNTTDRSESPAAQSVGSGGLFGLRTSADRLHQAIAVMLKDWRDGDFELPRLAEIHMAAIEEKYREVGKALRAADEPRMTLPTAAPTHWEIAWYVRELTEAKAREDRMLAALAVADDFAYAHREYAEMHHERIRAEFFPPNTEGSRDGA